MIFTKLLVAACVSLLVNQVAQAANVDFKAIYGNAVESCNDSHEAKNAANNHDGVNTQDASKNKPCESVKANKDYVEPKFSTKRPRGQ